MRYIRSFFDKQRLDRSTLPIAGPDGLSPEVNLMDHPIFGSIITSKYKIVRFYQDGLPNCYNAALAMYMHSTQPLQTAYFEMAYHDQGALPKFVTNETDILEKRLMQRDYEVNGYLSKRELLAEQFATINEKKLNKQAHAGKIDTGGTPFWDLTSDQLSIELETQYRNQARQIGLETRIANKWYENIKLYEQYGIRNPLFLRNLRENGLEAKNCTSTNGIFSNPHLSFYNYIKYVQTFERILSYGPVIACSETNSITFPHYGAQVGGGHAYLIYGITKYLYNGSVEAMLVCVDPNYPERDTLIPILAFADQRSAIIISRNGSQLRPNTNTLEYREDDLRKLDGQVLSKGIKDYIHKDYYRYSNGPNPRVVNLQNKIYHTKPKHGIIC